MEERMLLAPPDINTGLKTIFFYMYACASTCRYDMKIPNSSKCNYIY